MEDRDRETNIRGRSPIKTEVPAAIPTIPNGFPTRLAPDEKEENQEEDLKAEFEDIWSAFLHFEEFTYDADSSSFTGFLTEWQHRLSSALDLGLTYSETVLSLKLLKNSRLDAETRSNVFSSLQARPDILQANLLLFTLNALNGIKNESEVDKLSIKTELFEEYQDPKVQLEEHPDTAEDSRDCDDYYVPEEEEEEGGDHMALHQGPVRQFTCTTCSASFKSAKLRDRHAIVHENRDLLKCDACGKQFLGDKALKYHMKNVHKKNLRCNFCPKLFDRQSKLTKHEETHAKRQINQEAMFQCDQCGKEVQGKKGLRIHKRTHFQFRCQPCNKIFKDQDLLNRHVLNHREYPCEQCGQVYYQYALLQKHKNTITHGGERKFACDQCGKTFMKKYNLQTHQLTHTGEKNFKCEFEDCTMAFYKKDVMIRHMRIHTGEKPYQCDICERKFTQSGDMRKHRRTHGVE